MSTRVRKCDCKHSGLFRVSLENITARSFFAHKEEKKKKIRKLLKPKTLENNFLATIFFHGKYTCHLVKTENTKTLISAAGFRSKIYIEDHVNLVKKRLSQPPSVCV